MHIITKIFVVFAAVLAVLLSALSVAYSTNADRIVASVKDQRARVAALRAEVAAAASTHAEEVERIQAEVEELKQQVRDRTARLTSYERENQRLLAEAKAAQNDSLNVQSRIDQLSATASTQASLISSYRDEVQKLREDELRFTQREIELADRISDINGQLEVAVETNRALQEQIAQLREMVDGPGASRLASGPMSSRTQPVRARITDVRRDPGNGALLAAIDAGSNDRIREGMEMTIVRRGDFIAKFVVQSVTLNTAVGRVDTLNRSVDVLPGDMVSVVAR